MKGLRLIPLFTFLVGCASKVQQPTAPPPPSLPVMTVSTALDTTYLDYPASIQGALNVEIRPQVSGKLEKVRVDEGAYVKKGQTLFEINNLPFKAQWSNALAGLDAAKSGEANAALEVEKLTPLVTNKIISPFQLKTAKASLQVARSTVEQARAQLATARINLDYSVIKAPASGYIGLLAKKEGSLVGPTDPDPLTLLSDIHTVHVYFSLSENDFVNFKEAYGGETVADKLRQLPPVTLLLSDNTAYDTQGKIDVVDGQFDKNTGAITYRATFLNPKGLLRSGNTGKVRLGAIHKNALIIPESATVELQDKVFVFVVADSNKVKKQAIEIVGKSHDHFLVKTGVKAGDLIVLGGVDRLQDGEVIQPQKPSDKVVKN